MYKALKDEVTSFIKQVQEVSWLTLNKFPGSNEFLKFKEDS